VKNLAIVGQMAAGKTTLADYLVANYGYTRVSFAARLKELAATVYNKGQPIPKDMWFDDFAQRDKSGGLYMQNLTGRQLLQQIGQAIKALDELFWVKWLFCDMDAGLYGAGPYVIDDCRFSFEADALRERGFDTVGLDTPDAERNRRYKRLYGRLPSEEELSHPSETEVSKIYCDRTISGMRPVEEIAAMLMVD